MIRIADVCVCCFPVLLLCRLFGGVSLLCCLSLFILMCFLPCVSFLWLCVFVFCECFLLCCFVVVVFLLWDCVCLGGCVSCSVVGGSVFLCFVCLFSVVGVIVCVFFALLWVCLCCVCLFVFVLRGCLHVF